MSKNIDNIIACDPVEDMVVHEWSVTLYEKGGRLRGRWNGTTEMEPDHQTLVLYLEDKEVKSIKTGKRQGDVDLDHPWGSKYRLALRAKGFDGRFTDIVRTETTELNRPPPPPAIVSFAFIAKLEQQESKTWLGLATTAPFRPRQSQGQVYVEGHEKFWSWVETAEFEKVVDVRWGVGIDAAYTAETFDGRRMDLVRTPTTG